jgi:hypothetical protein
LKIALEPFARSCIESMFGHDLPAGAQAAVRYYADRLESERQPVAVPAFLRGDETQPAADVEFELAIPETVEQRLTAEARRNQVSVGRIIDHAIFVYLADLDAVDSEAKAKEAKSPARYRVYAHPRVQAAAARFGSIGGPVRARGCDGDRSGDTGPGAS